MIQYTSLSCPSCGESQTILITEDEYSQLQNGELIQNALSRFPASVRERYISGFCEKCWKNIFSPKKNKK